LAQGLDITPEDVLEARRELYRRSLSRFVRDAWPNIIPDVYQHGWHIDAVCEHLQAVARGQINRLLVNIPPGSSKSTLIGVMYPAWLWGPGGHPGHRYTPASFHAYRQPPGSSTP